MTLHNEIYNFWGTSDMISAYQMAGHVCFQNKTTIVVGTYTE